MSSTEKRYPLGTVALYGPTDKQATKLVASIYPTQRKEPAAVKKWNSAGGDVREDETIQAQLTQFLQAHQIAHAVVTEEVVGCPHEPGIDYPSGSVCPFCPFWAARPRSTTKESPSQPGRNDPCPCGSGRKFKKCCGANS